MRTFLQKQPLLSSLFVNLGLFLLTYTLFYSRFGTTDDIEMQMVLSGKMVLQTPSAYLRYSHIWVGEMLSSLYTFFPAISWYTYCLVSAHFAGMTMLLYSILKLNNTPFRLMTYIALFALGEVVLLQELQFTSASLVLQIGGIALLYWSFSQALINKKAVLIAATAMLWASMIRWESFGLGVVLGLPLLLLIIGQQPQKKLLKIAICLSIIGSAWLSNKWHYHVHNQHEDWATFHQYKHLGSGQAILDFHNPNYEWTANTADDYFYKVGWEYGDLQLFKHWFLADSSVYGYAQFEALQYTFGDCPLPTDYRNQKIWDFFIDYPLDDYVYHGFLVLLLCLIFLRGNRWQYSTLLATAILILILLASLYIYTHLPPRVSYGMSFYLMCLAALFFDYNTVMQRQTKIWTLVLIGFLAISSLKKATKSSAEVATQALYATQALDSLQAQPHQLYIGGGDYYLMPLITPFRSMSDSIFEGFNMLDFGHLSNTPTHYQQLANFGIDNIHTTAIDDSTIYLIHRPASSFLSWYTDFVRRHYDKNIELELVRKEEYLDVAVYRIVSIVETNNN